ncbi:MAG: hypothetical protein ACP5C3_00525 [Methanomicrobiales archaeon]
MFLVVIVGVSGCINIDLGDNDTINETEDTETDNQQDNQNNAISSSQAQSIANNYAQRYVPGAYPGNPSLSGNTYTVPFYGNGALVGEVEVSRSSGKIIDSWFQEPITQEDLE